MAGNDLNGGASVAYEFRHHFPRRTTSATVLATDDQQALTLAYDIANGAPVEVWRGDTLIGETQRSL